MSRKLLMCGGAPKDLIYKEYIADGKTGVIQSDDDSIMPYKNFAYLTEVKGEVRFNGYYPVYWRDEYKIAERDEETGNYIYTLSASSVTNPAEKVEIPFTLNKLLAKITRPDSVSKPGVYEDRLYWDDEKGEYMLEMNTRYDRFTNGDAWSHTGQYCAATTLNTTIPIVDSALVNNYPTILANRAILTWNDLTVDHYATKGITHYNNYGIRYCNYIENWAAASKETRDSQFSKPLCVVYAIEKEIIPTGIKSKIKIPLYDGGTNFEIKHTDRTYYNDTPQGYVTSYAKVKVEVAYCRAIKYVEMSGEMINIPSEVDIEGYKRVNAPAYLLSFSGNSDISTRGIVKYLHQQDEDEFAYPITIDEVGKEGVVTKIIKIGSELLGPNDLCYWDDTKGRYIISKNTGIYMVDSIINNYISSSYITINLPNLEPYEPSYSGWPYTVPPVQTPIPVSSSMNVTVYNYSEAIVEGNGTGTNVRYYYRPWEGKIVTEQMKQDLESYINDNPFHIRYQIVEEIIETDITKKIEIKLPKNKAVDLCMTNNGMNSNIKIAYPIISTPNIEYIDISGTDVEIPDEINGHKVRHDLNGIIKEIYGQIKINSGNEEPYFLSKQRDDGLYVYNIVASSITSPSKKKTVSIISEKNLIQWGNRFIDRMYWDDTKQCYTVEKHAEYYKYTGAESEDWSSWNSSKKQWWVTAPGSSLSHTSSTNIVPWMSANVPVTTSVSYNMDGYTKSVFGSSAASKFVYYNKNASSITVLRELLASEPLHIVGVLHKNQQQGSDGVWYGVNGVKTDTDIFKRYEIKLYKGGTKVSLSTEYLNAKVTISVPVEILE